jgi:hypothetical protein
MSFFRKRLTSAEIRYFAHREADRAREWISE